MTIRIRVQIKSKISTFPPPITLAPPGWTPATLPESRRLCDRVACLARTGAAVESALIMEPKPSYRNSPGEGEAVWALGGEKAEHGETRSSKLRAAAFGLTELTAQPRNGPPPHLLPPPRRRIVLRVRWRIYFVPWATARIRPGERFVRLPFPEKVLHTYGDVGSRPAKMLVVAAPSGFESFVGMVASGQEPG